MTAAAAAQPAQAKAPPAAAAAPPVFAPAIDSGVLDSGPVGSLSQIPVSAPSAPPPMDFSAARPVVQRKCEACENEERADEHDHDEAETMVRPRLEVGAADDPFEREADAIAGQVMAMRDSDVMAAQMDASVAAPSVQRACSACSSASRDDEVRARRSSTEASLDEEEAPRMRDSAAGGSGSAGGESIGASHGELTSGGSAMPDATRSFFEERMGRDLSDVRLHTGSAAHDFSASIGAKAFTYENHIWLGKGETTGPSFTMAHELAHVLQQTSPGAVGPGQAMAQRDTGTVRRSAPFFITGTSTNFRRQHSRIHDAAQKATRRANPNLLTEVPIPGATRRGTSRRKCGFADFYTASPVTIDGQSIIPMPGLKQANRGSSVVNFSMRSDLRDCRRFPWTIERGDNRITDITGSQAPRKSSDEITRLDAAPRSIKIGELKPAHDLDYRGRGVEQVNYYREGLRNTIRATNDYLATQAQAQTGGTAGIGHNQRWAARPDPYTSITIPTGWADNGDTARGYPIRSLKIRTTESLPAVPRTRGGTGRRSSRRTSIESGSATDIKGRWMMAQDTAHPGSGVYVYYLAPDPADIGTVLGDVNTTQQFVRTAQAIQRVLVPLRTAPEATPDTSRRGRRQLFARKTRAPRPKPKVQRRMEDNFDRRAWNSLRGAPGARRHSGRE
ncbi:MAG: DUF4157 domain-containing protein, partial [Pseudomonadota bacterium]